jgi:PRTRC genetic system protein A
MTSDLITYNVLKSGDEEIVAGYLYAYVFADDGVWIHASKPGLLVRFQIADCEIHGLQSTQEVFSMETPRVPLAMTEELIRRARQEALADQEILFHLLYDGEWNLVIPEQEAGSDHCRPTDTSENSSHDLALIEAHSHHNMEAFFSPQDDLDESTGFRIYAVVGGVLKNPGIMVRVGCRGYFWPIPASWVFEMPEGVKDVNFDGGEIDASDDYQAR